MDENSIFSIVERTKFEHVFAVLMYIPIMNEAMEREIKKIELEYDLRLLMGKKGRDVYVRFPRERQE